MYRKTLFDRLGPDAGSVVRAIFYGVAVFGLCLPMFAAASQKLEHQMSFGWNALWVFFWSLMCGAGSSLGSLWLANATGGVWKRFAVDGTSTPYREQYSYQQSLVMRGRLHEALESFEAVMAEKPDAVDVRLRAAELYAREQRNHARAAELFREVQRSPTATPGEDIYASNRLVDLLTGPLDNPGRALAELRRIVDRYPASAAAAHARGAIAALKGRVIGGADWPAEEASVTGSK